MRILSSYGNNFHRDVNLERPHYAPNVKRLADNSVFCKDDDRVVRYRVTSLPHFTGDAVRGMDLLGVVYNVLDMTPGGVVVGMRPIPLLEGLRDGSGIFHLSCLNRFGFFLCCIVVAFG